VNNNYGLVFYDKKTAIIDQEKPLTGLVCPPDERILDYNYGTFCSKELIIVGGEAFVLPDVLNFIMNSRYYIGHQTAMIKNPAQHSKAVGMSRALAAQSSTILTDIALSIERLNTPKTFTVVMRDFYQRFGDFWNSMP